jgi:hypothetical protein
MRGDHPNSQKDIILGMLQRGEEVTPYSALQAAGTLRLSERIRELESEGHDIVHQRVKRGSAWVCKYQLVPEVACALP